MERDVVLDRVTVLGNGQTSDVLIQEASVTFKAGQITLLIGRNGAGKTTLLETIAGLRKLEAGTIQIGSEPLWQEDKRRLKRNALLRLGISLQNAESQWFAATVAEELHYSLRPYNVTAEEADRRIEEAMSMMGLSMELLKQDPWTLSGGQQRRLSLACLLACEPDWLLLDEPTAGLDAVGKSRLCAALEAHRAAGRGVVVVTHDHSALWPLADAIAVVDGGIVRAAASPAAALAEAAAGEGAPQALRALAKLRALGAAVPPAAPPAQGGGAPWPAPRELAAALAMQARQRSALAASSAPAAHSDGAPSPAPQELAAAHKDAAVTATAVNVAVAATATPATAATAAVAATATAADGLLSEAEVAQQPQQPPAQRPAAAAPSARSNKPRLLASDYFDPRALVLAYLMLATVILLKNSAIELLAAGAASLLLLYPVRSLIRPWIRLIASYAVFIVICGFIAGIAFNPLSLNTNQAAATMMQLSKLLIVMLLGLPMLALTTPLRLQRSIEQSFGWLTALKMPIHSMALLVTLIFRFIPLLTEEWARFAKLVHARGKATTPIGSLPFSMLRVMIVPYIRSLLRLAEQMADALEARGFGIVRDRPTFGFRLKFSRADGILLLLAGCISLLLMTLHWATV